MKTIRCKCGASLKMKDKRLAELAGRKVKCPKCGRSKLLPNVPRKPTFSVMVSRPLQDESPVDQSFDLPDLQTTPEETHPEKAVAPLFQPKKKSRTTRVFNYSIAATMIIATLLAPVVMVVLTIMLSRSTMDGLVPMGDLGYGDPITGQTQTRESIMATSAIASFILVAVGYVVTIGVLAVIWFAAKIAFQGRS